MGKKFLNWFFGVIALIIAGVIVDYLSSDGILKALVDQFYKMSEKNPPVSDNSSAIAVSLDSLLREKEDWLKKNYSVCAKSGVNTFRDNEGKKQEDFDCSIKYSYYTGFEPTEYTIDILIKDKTQFKKLSDTYDFINGEFVLTGHGAFGL